MQGEKTLKLPLHDTTQNQVWPEIIQLALDLLARMPGWLRSP
jgi:hypothetical protein